VAKKMRAPTPTDPPATSVVLTPLTTDQPWGYAGVSRSCWYRLMSAGQAPKPLQLPGSRRRWRVADVARWVENLRTGR
jgi:predicted DNA-binding transcriptional regulator AlpA